MTDRVIVKERLLFLMNPLVSKITFFCLLEIAASVLFYLNPAISYSSIKSLFIIHNLTESETA